MGVVQLGGQLGPLVADLAQLALKQARLAPQVARATGQLVVVAFELKREMDTVATVFSLQYSVYLFAIRLVVEDLLIQLLYLTSLLLDHSL